MAWASCWSRSWMSGRAAAKASTIRPVLPASASGATSRRRSRTASVSRACSSPAVPAAPSESCPKRIPSSSSTKIATSRLSGNPRSPSRRSSARIAAKAWSRSWGGLMASTPGRSAGLSIAVADRRADGWADDPIGSPEEARELGRHPPAQDVEAAADADPGGGEDELEGRHGSHQEPAEQRRAGHDGERAEPDAGSPQGLGEPRRILVLERRRAEAERSPDHRPKAAGQEEPHAERGRDAQVEADEHGEPGQGQHEREDQDDRRDARAEALAAGIDLAGGWGEDAG